MKERDIYSFYKRNAKDKIWWVEHFIIIDKNKEITSDNVDIIIGELLISFDKKKIYNLWPDYPYNLTKEEKELFDKENPYWANFFKNRK